MARLRMPASTLTAFLMHTQIFTGSTAYVCRFLNMMVDIECHINAPVDSLHVPHATCQLGAKLRTLVAVCMRPLLL